ncbi:PAS domain-containing hybrid sensor histidine kinase/response regulator [Sediminicola luteus]|uniref:histidine kinase n=1 Tax=Sediminicola luteus TaxID=319238 RepID=A0A2A4G7X2_9FLAO|nr:PAS domain-containing hybrid sensor histidine kinase/response regulator [Sediminicola luteus]PCE64080.1 hypothetical protein B7P33_12655 [Sediminicola luteus]
MHRLLKRQLKKAALSESLLTEIAPFLDQINAAYTAFEDDLSHIETILEQSSTELFHTNKQLQQHMEAISSQLERVAGNIKEVIFEIDLNGCWSYLNPAWESLTGLKVSDCIGQRYTEHLICPDGQPIIDLSGPQAKAFTSLNNKTACIGSHEAKKWCDFSVKAMYGDGGEVEGFIGTIVDITNLKQTELALIEAKEQETQANKAKDEFLSTMSHEIRTPLHGVIGLSHILLAEDPKPEQMENLEALKYSSEHLLSLVTDILDFNKISSGNLKLEHAEFNLRGVLKGLQGIFKNRAREKDLDFVIKTDPRLPPRIMGDPTRLSQILTNLVGNAIKFTQKGHVMIEVETVAHQGKGIPLRFKVSDTGIGIPKEKRHTIFQSFEQASLDTTRKYGGTGLGLAICTRLLELMGSQLRVDSEMGQGSTFSFDLILGLPEYQPTTNTRISAGNENEEDLASLAHCKILLAEDNKVNILIIKKLMQKWQVDFEIVENGLLALESAMTKTYDLILMDLQMPVMNGYDASKAIRENVQGKNKDIPIYALSASNGSDIQEKLLEYGLDGLIGKPFDPDELFITLVGIMKNCKVGTD